MYVHIEGIIEPLDSSTSFAVIRALGILIDNALEETSRSGNSKFSVLLINSSSYLEVNVINDVTAGFELSNLNQSGFTTKGPDYLTFIQETVQQYLLIEELPAKIRLATTSATELLATIDWSAINDSIFLLDIELGDSATSGVDVATAIRKKSYYVDILFITSHVDEALRILEHKIAPLDMINKNSPSKTEKKIRNNILYAIKRLKARQVASPRLFSYSINSSIFSLEMDELIYIQTAPGVSGTLELHAENEITTFPGNLKELATKYTNLCRCHKSILINPAHVLRLDITNRFVYMDNQDKLEVSIRRIGELRNILTGTRALS